MRVSTVRQSRRADWQFSTRENDDEIALAYREGEPSFEVGQTAE